jgi:hypothetical protein
MALTKVERERITDSVLKLQSVRASLENIDATKVPEFEALETCLEDADKNLQIALRK